MSYITWRGKGSSDCPVSSSAPGERRAIDLPYNPGRNGGIFAQAKRIKRPRPRSHTQRWRKCPSALVGKDSRSFRNRGFFCPPLQPAISPTQAIRSAVACDRTTRPRRVAGSRRSAKRIRAARLFRRPFLWRPASQYLDRRRAGLSERFASSFLSAAPSEEAGAVTDCAFCATANARFIRAWNKRRVRDVSRNENRVALDSRQN